MSISVKTLLDNIKKLDRRPNWNEYFMLVANLIAKRSTCERLHVGCVIVKDNRIIATGYNGHVPGAAHESAIEDGHEQLTIHAETNAVGGPAQKDGGVKDATVYVTHFPCINCTKTLIAAGIKEIVYEEDYNNNKNCYKLFSLANVNVKKFII
ncbi:MAG: dCMP deaminase [Edafosvirus sp.]|uniref:dCMP deaminase n=1 Tax=Edafosvirus sp. TaxID=2487765 RepID=A0A3G4ZTV4_9VIRU|nr:MAG: dCMP deaminase [Edafosvirus sp.]